VPTSRQAAPRRIPLAPTITAVSYNRGTMGGTGLLRGGRPDKTPDRPDEAAVISVPREVS
jgi:hypothetical protein